MKTLLPSLLLTVFLTVSGVNGGPGGGGGGGLKGGRKLFDWFLKEANPCSCTAWYASPCSGVTGTRIMGCPGSNSFIQCKDTVCSVQPCPDGQLWNYEQNACAPCAAGMHIAASKRSCVCDTGKTFDGKTKTCVDCPTDSTKEADRCYCPVTKSYDKKNNACKDCPQLSTLIRNGQCQCNPAADGATRFFSETDWACKDCPGVWTPIQKRRPFWRRGSECTCNGLNQIFDRKSVTCFDCPSGTTAWKNDCACPNRFMTFNMDTKKCECIDGLAPDATGGCVKPAAPAAPSGGNP